MTQPFQFANGQLAYSAEDLLQLCQQFPEDGTNYLVREDLEKWLAYIGKNDIAQCAANARQTSLENRQKLEEFLNKCHALSSPPSTTDSVKEEVPVAVEEEEVSTPTPVATPKTEPVTSESSVTTKSEASAIPPAPAVQPSTTVNSDHSHSNSKPSFFKVIARLIINVLYRHKN